MGQKGTLYVISAPSGTGKSTLIRALMERVGGLAFSVSHTTRKPRPGEANGRDYHFVSEETFRQMVERDEFLEWAEVHKNLYGTSQKEVQDRLDRGIDVILDIDVQGFDQVKRHMPHAASIFILPPSVEEIGRRLRARNKDTAEVIETRLVNAVEEMKRAQEYDCRIINDEFPAALKELETVVLAHRKSARPER